jgi:hypothetical protein
MNTVTFILLESVCKAGWKALSVTGSEDKPKFLACFYNNCPACHLAILADPNKDKENQNPCLYCPITEWRQEAIRLAESEPENSDLGYTSVCDSLNGECVNYYRKWRISGHDDRKKNAQIISEMEWSWLPEYDKVRITESRYSAALLSYNQTKEIGETLDMFSTDW